MREHSKKPIDNLKDRLKAFEFRYGNKIAELINSVDNNKNKNGKEEDDGGEEFEEVEAPQSVYHAEIGKAWEQYLKKHGIVIDYTNPKNFQDSEYIWALYQTFCDEWDKQPHQKKIMIRVKKRWTEEEKAALREEIKKEKEEAAKHCFGFKD